jgi:hypothetical protein
MLPWPWLANHRVWPSGERQRAVLVQRTVEHAAQVFGRAPVTGGGGPKGCADVRSSQAAFAVAHEIEPTPVGRAQALLSCAGPFTVGGRASGTDQVSPVRRLM